MEMDEEGLLRKLAEIGSGPGGATAGKADSGELYGLAGFFSAELRAAFDRVKLQLAELDATVGLDSISIMTSPKVAEAFFRLVEKLVASELASSDVFNKFSDIAKTATTAKKKGYAALWSSLYRSKFFWAEKDYADTEDGHGVRVDGVPNIHDVGDTQAALDHGLPHFAKERDLISGFVCNYVFSRCDTAFRTRVKALFKVSGVDATKQLGDFHDYCGLRAAIIRCLPSLPPALLLPLLKFAAVSVRGPTLTGKETHVDRMLAASNRATETMVSVGKRLVAALLQSPVADLDTPAFAAQNFTGANLLDLAPLFGISFLRGSLVTDALVLSAQMHANKPLVVDSVVGGRDVRVLNPDYNQWDQTTHLAVGRIVQQQISALSTGDFGKRVNDALHSEGHAAGQAKRAKVRGSGGAGTQSQQQREGLMVGANAVAAGGASGGAVADALNASTNVSTVPSKRKADGVKKTSSIPRQCIFSKLVVAQ